MSKVQVVRVMPILIHFVVNGFGQTVFRSSGTSFAISNRTKEKCTVEYKQLLKPMKKLVTSLELEGHWVSEKCEFVAGPRFLLRDYQLDKSGIFQIHHYEYRDQYCSVPVRGYTLTGKIFGLSKSSNVFGGQKVDYAVSRVTVVPYIKEDCRKLNSALAKLCPELGWSIKTLEETTIFQNYSKRFAHLEREDYDVYDSEATDKYNLDSRNFDCLRAANFSFFTLNLARMDEIAYQNNDNDDTSDKDQLFFFAQYKLYFGRAIWNPFNQTYSPPNSFAHYSLIELNQVRNCKTCEKIRDANQLNPPVLKQLGLNNQLSSTATVTAFDKLLKGDWLSADCESYINGFFGFRLLTFRSVKPGRKRRNHKSGYNKWKLRQSYYWDPLCRQLSHVVIAEGHYELSDAAGEDPRANSLKKLVLKTVSIQVTPKSKKFLSRRNRFRRSCQRYEKIKWRLNVSSDVTKFVGLTCYSGWLGFIAPQQIIEFIWLFLDSINPSNLNLLIGNGDLVGDSAPVLKKCEETKARQSTSTAAYRYDSHSIQIDTGNQLSSGVNKWNASETNVQQSIIKKFNQKNDNYNFRYSLDFYSKAKSGSASLLEPIFHLRCILIALIYCYR